MGNKYRLTMELIPFSSMGMNLHNYISRKDWDKIRKKIYKEQNYECGICGKKTDKLECHEKWEFDSDKKVQRLSDMIALCKKCHLIKHIGFANILSTKGKIDYEELINHFTNVNKCSKDDFYKLRSKAKKIHLKRSKYDWEIDLGKYEKLRIHKYSEKKRKLYNKINKLIHNEKLNDFYNRGGEIYWDGGSLNFKIEGEDLPRFENIEAVKIVRKIQNLTYIDINSDFKIDEFNELFGYNY